MNLETIIHCIVALILGMLLAHMLKDVCGCNKVVEGAWNYAWGDLPTSDDKGNCNAKDYQNACGATSTSDPTCGVCWRVLDDGGGVYNPTYKQPIYSTWEYCCGTTAGGGIVIPAGMNCYPSGSARTAEMANLYGDRWRHQ